MASSMFYFKHVSDFEDDETKGTTHDLGQAAFSLICSSVFLRRATRVLLSLLESAVKRSFPLKIQWAKACV